MAAIMETCSFKSHDDQLRRSSFSWAFIGRWCSLALLVPRARTWVCIVDSVVEVLLVLACFCSVIHFHMVNEEANAAGG